MQPVCCIVISNRNQDRKLEATLAQNFIAHHAYQTSQGLHCYSFVATTLCPQASTTSPGSIYIHLLYPQYPGYVQSIYFGGSMNCLHMAKDTNLDSVWAKFYLFSSWAGVSCTFVFFSNIYTCFLPNHCPSEDSDSPRYSNCAIAQVDASEVSGWQGQEQMGHQKGS